jgi:hypothetical protein
MFLAVPSVKDINFWKLKTAGKFSTKTIYSC